MGDADGDSEIVFSNGGGVLRAWVGNYGTSGPIFYVAA